MDVRVYRGSGTKVAKLPGVQAELDKGAQKVLARAKANAAAHFKTGAYAASLGVAVVPGRNGVKDRMVYSSDPAAVPIEFGHVAANGRVVPGQRILLNALYGSGV